MNHLRQVIRHGGTSLLGTLALLLVAGCSSTGGFGTGLIEGDRQRMLAAMQTALESKRTGESINWSGQDSEAIGTITPIRTHNSSGGRPCRDFQRSLTVRGSTNVEFGTACRNADGRWVVTDTRAAYRDGNYVASDHYHDPYWGYPYGSYGYGYPSSRFMFGYGHRYWW